ncbi:MAG TPA: hypothetical protein VNA19_04620 [Pyrinomonadaceae bacterium]|jgi:hypothetical protein|nr:hypothetical protein [Pyrinomonadaceae bacterium]
MKSLSIVLLLFACAASVVAAQQGAGEMSAAATADAPDAQVVGFGWKYEGYSHVEIMDGNSKPTSMRVTRQKGYVFKYKAQATVRNTGAKTVKSLYWDYVFADPEDASKELKRYKIQSKQQILPGQTQTLTKELFHEPKESTRHVTAGRQSVLVTRIEYTDGTVWKSKDEGGRMKDE